MSESWLASFRQHVEKKPIAILRLDNEEWRRLRESRRGVSQFTMARAHEELESIGIPSACVIEGSPDEGCLYLGLVTSRSAVTTFESRIKVSRAVQIQPASLESLIALMPDKWSNSFRAQLRSITSITALSPKLSSHLIKSIALISTNHGPMRVVAGGLLRPRAFYGPIALQEDAIRLALSAFGLSTSDHARSLQLVEGQETSLERVNITEDSVIEHDARHVSGYSLVDSSLTGRAVFEKNGQVLEVFTANRRPLEHVFGVDLVYLNTTKRNIIMLQYKMLEPVRQGDQIDWVYRPDKQLTEELRRMSKFDAALQADTSEYRLNPGVFYLKFVKRDGFIRNGSIITPIDHFETIRVDPSFRGQRNGFSISYDKLSGRYLRESAFLDLIRSGYIGGYSKTTEHLEALVTAVLEGNRAVVAAIQS